jgi:uncharacterized protein with PQ loop repeat
MLERVDISTNRPMYFFQVLFCRFFDPVKSTNLSYVKAVFCTNYFLHVHMYWIALEMDWAQYIAVVATVCSLIANLPQVWKSRKVGCTEDLHLYTFVIHFVGCVLWSVYAFGMNLHIMFVECIICGVLNFVIITFIVRDTSINTTEDT